MEKTTSTGTGRDSPIPRSPSPDTSEWEIGCADALLTLSSTAWDDARTSLWDDLLPELRPDGPALDVPAMASVNHGSSLGAPVNIVPDFDAQGEREPKVGLVLASYFLSW
jgi:hypothetical protein